MTTKATGLSSSLGNRCGLPPLDDVFLQGTEELQAHMDCMDGSGRVVAIEDIDEVGGQVR